MTDIIAQTGIIVFSGLSIWFVGRKHHDWRRWGYILGLCSQPFWFMTTIHNQQWGLVMLSVYYTWAWGLGLKNNWRAE